MAQEFYRNGRYVVSSGMVRAWNRSIQLGTIEGVDLTRPLFLMALGGAGGAVGFGLLWGDLLYFPEIAGFVATGIGVLILSWQVGSLRIYSKLTGQKGWSAFGWFTGLRTMRDAIEEALAEQGHLPLRYTGDLIGDDTAE